MPNIIILVGPPGSGKSTFAKSIEMESYRYINQDSQGKNEHFILFQQAIKLKQDIVVDRMNFNKLQRKRYIDEAVGYAVEIHSVYNNILFY